MEIFDLYLNNLRSASTGQEVLQQMRQELTGGEVEPDIQGEINTVVQKAIQEGVEGLDAYEKAVIQQMRPDLLQGYSADATPMGDGYQIQTDIPTIPGLSQAAQYGGDTERVRETTVYDYDPDKTHPNLPSETVELTPGDLMQEELEESFGKHVGPKGTHVEDEHGLLRLKEDPFDAHQPTVEDFVPTQIPEIPGLRQMGMFSTFADNVGVFEGAPELPYEGKSPKPSLRYKTITKDREEEDIKDGPAHGAPGLTPPRFKVRDRERMEERMAQSIPDDFIQTMSSIGGEYLHTLSGGAMGFKFTPTKGTQLRKMYIEKTGAFVQHVGEDGYVVVSPPRNLNEDKLIQAGVGGSGYGDNREGAGVDAGVGDSGAVSKLSAPQIHTVDDRDKDDVMILPHHIGEDQKREMKALRLWVQATRHIDDIVTMERNSQAGNKRHTEIEKFLDLPNGLENYIKTLRPNEAQEAEQHISDKLSPAHAKYFRQNAPHFYPQESGRTDIPRSTNYQEGLGDIAKQWGRDLADSTKDVFRTGPSELQQLRQRNKDRGQAKDPYFWKTPKQKQEMMDQRLPRANESSESPDDTPIEEMDNRPSWERDERMKHDYKAPVDPRDWKGTPPKGGDISMEEAGFPKSTHADPEMEGPDSGQKWSDYSSEAKQYGKKPMQQPEPEETPSVNIPRDDNWKDFLSGDTGEYELQDVDEDEESWGGKTAEVYEESKLQNAPSSAMDPGHKTQEQEYKTEVITDPSFQPQQEEEHPHELIQPQVQAVPPQQVQQPQQVPVQPTAQQGVDTDGDGQADDFDGDGVADYYSTQGYGYNQPFGGVPGQQDPGRFGQWRNMEPRGVDELNPQTNKPEMKYGPSAFLTEKEKKQDQHKPRSTFDREVGKSDPISLENVSKEGPIKEYVEKPERVDRKGPGIQGLAKALQSVEQLAWLDDLQAEDFAMKIWKNNKGLQGAIRSLGAKGLNQWRNYGDNEDKFQQMIEHTGLTRPPQRTDKFQHSDTPGKMETIDPGVDVQPRKSTPLSADPEEMAFLDERAREQAVRDPLEQTQWVDPVQMPEPEQEEKQQSVVERMVNRAPDVVNTLADYL